MAEMSDGAHAAEATQIDVAGYRSCRNEHCGALVILEIAERTRGLCTECFRGHLGQSLAEIEVRIQGRNMTMKMPRKRKKDGKGNAWTHKMSNRARARADKRLRQLFRDLYEVLLAEERARLGLEPFPIETAITEPPGDPSQSIEFARVYAALDEHGVDVDGPEGTPT